MMRWILTSLLLCLAGIVSSLSASGNRLLVILEDAAEKSKYGKFFGDLESRGFQLTFESPKKDGLDLFHLGSKAYDHLLLLPPKSKAYGPALTPNILLDFLKADGNILLGLSSSSPVPSGIVSLLLELDIHLPQDKGSTTIDHFNHDASSREEHDILLIPSPKDIPNTPKNFFGATANQNIQSLAVPHVVGQVLGVSSPLVFPILRAPDTAYIANSKEDNLEDLFASGSQISLVSAHQGRNNARLAVVGSVDMLQDIYFDNAKYGNEAFSKQISAWTFKELGVLKVGRFEHWLREDSQSSTNVTELNPTIYRIKNDVTFQIEISEYAYDRWTPFNIPSGDELQLEFSMLSPFHRVSLKPVSTSSDSTIFAASFKTPDQHGIFNFRVNYKRPFLTNVDEKRQVTVRHFAHDEWPRSWVISGAWVWIAGIWGTIAGWVAFVAVWLYSAPTKHTVSGKKIQ